MSVSTAAISARVLAVSVGSVAPLPFRGSTVPSGIRKLPVDGPLPVDAHGLARDEQADLAHHGGPDKALCAYPSEHYPQWEERLGRRLAPGALGENLTLAGLTEDAVCIGDAFTLGSAVVAVSQPRQPCFKLAALHGAPKMALWVQESGSTGFYLRVLEPGDVEAGDALVLRDRPHPALTVQEANRLMHRDRHDLPALRRMLVPELSASWHRTLSRRLP